MLVLILIIPPGVDCRGLGLKDLRQAVSYLGQEPVMFFGTLRENLDPEDTLSDTTIWHAIKSCHCSEFVIGLGDDVIDGGVNFSVGARQLLCLAKAVLQRKKVF